MLAYPRVRVNLHTYYFDMGKLSQFLMFLASTGWTICLHLSTVSVDNLWSAQWQYYPWRTQRIKHTARKQVQFFHVSWGSLWTLLWWKMPNPDAVRYLESVEASTLFWFAETSAQWDPLESRRMKYVGIYFYVFFHIGCEKENPLHAQP